MSDDNQNVVEVPSLGEQELLPLSDAAIRLIHNGLLIPSQGAAKSMAHELRRWRGDPNPDSV